MGLRAFLIAAASVILCSTAAMADSIADQYPIGSAYEGSIIVSRTTVPLPDGRWSVSSVNETRNNNNNVIISISLANITNGKFFGHVSISTNVDIGNGGWVLHNFCDRTDVYFIRKDSQYNREQACWGINHYIMDQTSTYTPQFGKNIRKYLLENGLSMPRLMIGALFRLSGEMKFITYEIFINPEYYGFSSSETSWANSPWHKDMISRYPDRIRFIDDLKEKFSPIYENLRSQF